MSELNSIGTIITRVESLENRFSENTKRIESRLDDLFELMQKVTQLQEREARNADDIKDLRDSIKLIIENQERMNQRWHERLDNQSKEVENCSVTLRKSFEAEHKDVEVELKRLTLDNKLELTELRKDHQKSKEEFDKWFNRGVGAWVILTLFIGILQVSGGYILKTYLDEIKVMKDKIIQIESRLK